MPFVFSKLLCTLLYIPFILDINTPLFLILQKFFIQCLKCQQIFLNKILIQSSNPGSAFYFYHYTPFLLFKHAILTFPLLFVPKHCYFIYPLAICVSSSFQHYFSHISFVPINQIESFLSSIPSSILHLPVPIVFDITSLASTTPAPSALPKLSR